jgi:phosphocarrier protein HPr
MIRMSEQWVRRQLKIARPEGLHIRPAAELSKLASQFAARIILRYGDREVDAKSVLDILTLGAMPGETVELCASGSDASLAVDALSEKWVELLGSVDPPGDAES